jgi:hypothetical protein
MSWFPAGVKRRAAHPAFDLTAGAESADRDAPEAVDCILIFLPALAGGAIFWVSHSGIREDELKSGTFGRESR